ncbi:MAG: 16S rRNA (cytidine(1402)-2'-O)-methyltransferase [Bacteroidota bacterium]|nr:16S rRNA (cytidine(1402)-2'-O)-methyltransferase [Bacteroidota bacterium]
MAKLYIVPTPIGNLEDFTFRAVRILKEVDVILAEDTRVTAKLLSHYGIDKKLVPHHQHNEHKTVEYIASMIANGMSLALVTDAGTPGISDPGFMLVRECLRQGLEVETLPGATAFVPALVNSGLPIDRFLFEGFLPHKKGRQTKLKWLAQQPYTIVLYESPYRLLKTLDQIAEFFGSDRQVSVARELTKIYEENIRGTVSEVKSYFNQKTIKGEIVIIVDGFGSKQERSSSSQEPDDEEE